jgi:hypothetical protein|eukprot:COSAG06_NODE_6169_length_3071_cov_1.593203_2_plen_48_part_00
MVAATHLQGTADAVYVFTDVVGLGAAQLSNRCPKELHMGRCGEERVS